MKPASQVTIDIASSHSAIFDPRTEIELTEIEAVVPRAKRGHPVANSLYIDLAFLLVASVMGYGLGYIISLVNSGLGLQIAMIAPPQRLMFFSVASVALVFLLLDSFRAIALPSRLPARSAKRAWSIYTRRLHWFLAAFFFDAMVIALGWSAAEMPVVSKFFIAAVFALALYASSRSIPSLRLSFWLMSGLFLAMLAATQAFILLSLQLAEWVPDEPIQPPPPLRTQPMGAVDP